MANSRKRISELPPLNVASLDTTFVLGISGSTTYKISINNLTSSLDTTFASDLVTATLSSSLDGKLSTSSFNSYTASAINGTISGSSQLTSSYDQRYVLSGSITQTTWDNIANKPNDIVSSSTQISDLGFVTGSYTTINSFNSLTQSFNSISQSFTTISGSVGTIDFGGINAVTASYLAFTQSYTTDSSSFNSRITTEKNRIDAILSASNANTDTFAEVVSLINSVDLTNDNAFATFYTASNGRLTSLESSTGSYLTSLSGAISSSSQLTSSYDTRYVISGSVGATPLGTISSSAQITAFGFISSSQTINTASLATTGSNSFNGNQTITGSLVVSSVAVVNGGVTIPTGSVITLTSGSSISVDSSGAITGSLTGSIFGIGDVVAFSASLNSRIISGSAVAGTISGSSQLTSSYDSRYSLSGSVLTSFSSSVDTRLDTLEASIITGSVNYVQTLGARVTGVTSTGVTIITGSITTTGNPIQIMVTGDANPVNVTSWTRLQIYRNETAIGNIVQVENSSNLNVPYCLNVIDTPSAGTYTYSMRTVSGITGLFDFGESTGPTLTAVELRTNTNLPSTNNTFTGTNTFNNTTTFASAGGDEGGEIQFGVPVTNTTLQNRVTVDVWQNRLRFFEGSANANGVYIDLSKPTTGNNNEITYKASGIVNAGTFVTLDNIKATVTTSGQRGLSLATVSGTFVCNIAGNFAGAVVGASGFGGTATITTSASTSIFGWGFTTQGDIATYIITDTTNSRAYRIIIQIGGSYLNNLVSIERLH